MDNIINNGFKNSNKSAIDLEETWESLRLPNNMNDLSYDIKIKK